MSRKPAVAVCGEVVTVPLDTGKQLLIIDAINRRLSPRSLVCPISGDSNWTVDAYIAALPVTDAPPGVRYGIGSYYPLAVITCGTCGYTHLVNLFKLGLADVLNLEPVLD